MPTALLVIDMQRSLLEDETFEPECLRERVALLIAAARAAGAPVLFIADSRVEPHPELDTSLDRRPGDRSLVKDHCDSFLDTTLQADLAAAGIDHLVICGLQTDFCIDTTCRRAVSLGYAVTLAGDAHSTFERDDMPAALVIRHHNRILAGFGAGRARITVAPSDAVTFP